MHPAYLNAVLFAIIKAYAKLAIHFYCRKIVINHPDWLKARGPLLLACNHPNSFLDGIILTTLFQCPVYSLARGDAFRKPWHGRLLRWLHLLPVYRTSEGVENLESNYTTFEACREVFRNNGIVIIFSEGRCINEWQLRPLKKGTARLATKAWEEGIDLTVLPVGLNYNTFRNFGKNVFIHFGTPLEKEEIMAHETDGRMFLTFNALLREGLQGLVYEIDPADKMTLKTQVAVPVPLWKWILLSIPALAGCLTHVPLYFPARAITAHYFDNDHFDSVLASILVLAYPLYLLLWFLLASLIINWTAGFFVGLLLPFSAWSCVQLKPQV
jgi:1-acyl-sn-glycerol-3-phosphate acyltransferase